MRTLQDIKNQEAANRIARDKVAKAEMIWAIEGAKAMKNGTKAPGIAEIYASLEVA